MPECFDLALKDGVAHLRMSRPEAMNTMTPAFWRELPALVNELSDAGEARVIVLSSTGRHFTAGMDLAVFQGRGTPVIVGVGLSDAPKAPHLDSIGHHVQAIQRALADCGVEKRAIDGYLGAGMEGAPPTPSRWPSTSASTTATSTAP
jgi:enoyl-CoA hydratase/carnithine racemase